jgi:pyruvate dehydrogenase kinase 2/3/4
VWSQYTPFSYVCLSFLLDSGQHVELHSPNPPPHVVGYIHTRMSPVEVARNAVDDARSICSRQYGSAPDVHIYGDPDFTFP